MKNTTPKIGFACKWIDHPGQVDGIKPKDDAKKYNTGSTTVAWLNRQSQHVAEEKLWDLMKDNIEATRLLVERVGTLNENLRMVRLSSDILPVYTEPTWSRFGGFPMYEHIAKKDLDKSEMWLARVAFGCLCIPVSLLFLHLITQIL